MIYLDNAATTYPKPPQVYRSFAEAIRTFGANPGRGGYAFSENTSEAVYESRELCSEMFGAEPENTVFTLNCTHALNYAIKGLSRRGVHYVISDLEHNAVLRAVHSAAAANGGSYSIFTVDEDDEVTLKRAERAVKGETVALIATAASNVIGRRLPLSGLSEICKRHKICFVVDGAQGGGVLPLSLQSGINILSLAGHKGLYGPMGTGLMLTDGKFPLKTLIEGGTGSASESPRQPDFTPDRFESGTINTAGVIALKSGAEFVKRRTPEAIMAHEIALCRQLCEGVKKLPNVTLYNNITDKNSGKYAPVVSLNIGDMSGAEGAARLGELGFCLRGGLHCAPMAHRKIGTIDRGTVRFSPSVFTTPNEVEVLLRVLSKID